MKDSEKNDLEGLYHRGQDFLSPGRSGGQDNGLVGKEVGPREQHEEEEEGRRRSGRQWK